MTLQSSYVERSETLHKSTLNAGLTPIDVHPDDVASSGTVDSMIPGVAFVGAVCGSNSGNGCLIHSSATERLYSRLYLFDPAISVNARTVSLHVNEGILTMPAHHAKIDVKISGKMDMQRWSGLYVRGHLVCREHTALTNCLTAMRDMARASDKIAISTKHVRAAVAGIQHTAGSMVAGALTERI